jgi:hypothetical protein
VPLDIADGHPDLCLAERITVANAYFIVAFSLMGRWMIVVRRRSSSELRSATLVV